MERHGLRPVEINGHHYYSKGFFHQMVDNGGEACYAIEDEDGRLKFFPIRLYQIQFTDVRDKAKTD